MTDKFLVTGADGFIGSHLVETLVKSGHQVRAFSQYNSFNTWGWLENIDSSIMKSVEVFTGDVRDANGVLTAAKGCSKIYHLAALIGIPYSYHSPQAYLDTNITGTLNVLQAARTLDISRVVHTSTSECYGSAQFVPITENHPLVGQSPYAATKIAADQLAYSFYASFGTPVITLRPFNTFGPRQSARAVIPTIITQIQKGKREINLGSLSTRRDFNYVQDTVHGFIQAGKCKDQNLGQVFNVCSGVDFSIEETAHMIAKASNVDITLNVEGERIRPEKSEVERLLGDSSKAQKELGYQPQYGGKEGFLKALEETIDWFSQKENLRHYKSDIYNI